MIALDPDSPAHFLPSFRRGERALDIGCGAGQTLIAACPYRLPGEGGGCVTCARTDNLCQGWASGIDVDEDAIRVGHEWSRVLQLQTGPAEHLPYKDGEFDVVISRVALVYMDMRTVLGEVRRVLRPKGRIWLTLYPLSMVTGQIPRRNWRGLLYLAYVALNGIFFHLTLRTFSLFGRREYWQTPSSMRRVLAKYGFKDVQVDTRADGLTISASLPR